MNDTSQKSNKPIILAIFGKSAAGKDTVKSILRNYPIFHIMRQWTTRPKREKETQDSEYHFCSIEEFTQQLLSTESMLEAAMYKDWYYGTPTSEILKDKINVGIFGPKVIDCLLEEQRNYNIYFAEIIAKDKERLLRSLNREKEPNCEEICRRFLSDEKDFIEFHLKIESENSINFYELSGENLLSFGSPFPIELKQKIEEAFGPIRRNKNK